MMMNDAYLIACYHVNDAYLIARFGIHHTSYYIIHHNDAYLIACFGNSRPIKGVCLQWGYVYSGGMFIVGVL